MVGLIDFSNPIFNYSYKGYTAIINQIVDIAIDHFGRYGNTDLIISDEQILYYFNPINNIDESDYNASNVFLDNFFKNQTRHNTHNAHTLADKNDLNLRNEILNKILSPKPFLIEEINNLLTTLKIDDKTLGLQIRGTDKTSEIPRIPDNIIIESITKTLNENQLNKIFLSTDDNYYLELIKNSFKEILVYNENNIISHDGNPLHFSNDRKKINKDVLLDVYLLSNCEYFLYCYSNVSYLALTLGSQKQKIIKNINYEN
jgi:hypothetical protein